MAGGGRGGCDSLTKLSLMLAPRVLHRRQPERVHSIVTWASCRKRAMTALARALHGQGTGVSQQADGGSLPSAWTVVECHTAVSAC
eukprot:6332881-Amphidinium_carterae.1